MRGIQPYTSTQIYVLHEFSLYTSGNYVMKYYFPIDNAANSLPIFIIKYFCYITAVVIILYMYR